jgi:Fe-S cluster assembly ATPase SufC
LGHSILPLESNFDGKYVVEGKSESESESESDSESDISEPHVFDIQILGKCSGGEKARLAIAKKLDEADKKKAKCLILDEFEQGSDPEIAYKIINENIVNSKEFANTTIIVISHLERIQTVIDWNQYWIISDGIIKRLQ